MDRIQDKLVLKGYLEGYKDGFRDGQNGKTAEKPYRDFKELPIKVMPLTARARNCLAVAGCVCVADVISMSETKIARTRNLGAVTAREIALWLAENGIFESAWCKYL